MKKFLKTYKKDGKIMQNILVNKDNLKEEDVTEVVKRVKILLINSNQEILLAYSNNNYHFPGGHVEDNEELIEAVKREIKEEVGIDINFLSSPFVKLEGFYKDWPNKGENRKNEIYYYEIITDIKPDLSKTNYTDNEKKGNFELRYISLDKIEDELIDNVNKYSDKKGIAKEMLEIIKIYKGK